MAIVITGASTGIGYATATRLAAHGHVSSIAGLVAGAMLGPYHASKFALEAMTDTMRAELAPWGIEVVAVEPGRISTPIWSTSSQRADGMLGARQGEAEALYGARMRAARDGAIAAQRDGIRADEVAKVIENALTARRPRTRYRVGRDAKLVAAVVRRLPDRTRDRLLSR